MKPSCGVCGSARLKSFFDLGYVPLCDYYTSDVVSALSQPAFPIRTLICGVCLHVQLEIMVDCAPLYKSYLYRSSHSVDLMTHFADYARFVASRLKIPLVSRVEVLDIGCNDGVLLSAFGEMYPEATLVGLDPSPAALDCAENINVVNSFFDDAAINQNSLGGRFDLIFCNNTIANIEDPIEFTRNIVKCLSPNGHIVIETGYAPLTLINEVWDMVNHEHFHYFSLRSLDELASRCGLFVVDAVLSQTKGGSIRVILSKNAPAHLESSHLSIISFENTFFRFKDSLIDKTNQRLAHGRAAARKLQLTNESLVLIGASAGSTILVHAFGLASRDAELVDDNPIRHGLYLPGSSLHVAPISELQDLGRKTVIFLAWRFVEHIRRLHPQLRDSKRVLLGNSFSEIFIDGQ